MVIECIIGRTKKVIGFMLLKMSVSNFRSFDGVATLDLLSSTKVRKLPSHTVTVKKLKVLRNAAIYGANASGKSNLWRSFMFMQQSVSTGSLPLGTTEWFCKLREENELLPTSFDLMFEVDGHFFDYGFSALLKERRVVSEWLYYLEPKTDKKWNSSILFEYSEDAANGPYPKLGEAPGATDNDRGRLELYARDFTWGAEQLFLTELNRNKRYEEGSSFLLYTKVYRAIVDELRVMGAGEAMPLPPTYLQSDNLSRISSLLAGFDTGIESIKPRKVTQAELRDLVPVTMLTDMRRFAQKIALQPDRDKKSKYRVVARAPEALIVIEGIDQSEPLVWTLTLKHSGSFFDYEYGEESEGTQRLLDFMEMLLCDEDAVFIVDEIDRSLHPMLTKHLVELFNEMHDNDRAQLIFTTHEDSLMDFECLRKDEIWFVDRKEGKGSTLYPLDVFAEVRSDSSVDKNYWNGRYGGVPVLSSIQSMVGR